MEHKRNPYQSEVFIIPDLVYQELHFYYMFEVPMIIEKIECMADGTNPENVYAWNITVRHYNPFGGTDKDTIWDMCATYLRKPPEENNDEEYANLAVTVLPYGRAEFEYEVKEKDKEIEED